MYILWDDLSWGLKTVHLYTPCIRELVATYIGTRNSEAAAWISTCLPRQAFLCMFWRCDSIVPDVTLQRRLSRLQKINFTSSSLKVWCNSSKPLSCWLSARNEQFRSGSTLLMHLLWIARNCSADCAPLNCCIPVGECHNIIYCKFLVNNSIG